MARKTPQEKKRASYLKDRRNTYGENSKSSRKNIRLRKRRVNRANRRDAQQTTASATAMACDQERADHTELKLAGKRPKSWAKSPDTLLGEVVEKKLKRRARLGIDRPAAVRAKLKRIRRRTR